MAKQRTIVSWYRLVDRNPSGSRRFAQQAGFTVHSHCLKRHLSPPCGGVDRNDTSERSRQFLNVAPMRGRGSKPVAHRLAFGQHRRPHAGAWIETTGSSPTGAASLSPPCGGVDRNVAEHGSASGARWSPPCGGVDRNMMNDATVGVLRKSPPCGGVDRNIMASSAAFSESSRPHAGAWIETCSGLCGVVSD